MKRVLESFATLLFICGVLRSVPSAHGQVTVQILHHFGGKPDGSQPFGPIIQGSDGMLYGTTENSGGYGFGTVFKLSTNGTRYEVIHSFGPADGNLSNPQGALVQDRKGFLYGTAGPDAVFKLATNGADFEILNGSGGAAQGTVVLGTDGAFYGTRMEGGNSGVGMVFKLTSLGRFSAIHSFKDWGVGGKSPHPGLIQGKGGALYGTARGGSNDAGVVFRLNTDGSSYGVLHSFATNGIDGRSPQAILLQGNDGRLYGTTYGGGTHNAGTIFRLDADGSGYRIIHSFSLKAGEGHYPGPAGLVQGADGRLYGTTHSGGDKPTGRLDSPCAIVFTLNTDGSDYAVLYRPGNFYGGPGVGGPCFGLTPGKDGVLYGTTAYGGNFGNGTVFRLLLTPFGFTSYRMLPNRAFELSLKGASNSIYAIEASVDRVNWTALGQVSNATGIVRFIDNSAPKFMRRCYRAVWSP